MITIVDYGMSNIRSVAKAFEVIGCEVCISSNPDELETCERIVLPGDGAFVSGMENLRERGLIDPLRREVIEKGKPFLGICLGMQLLARKGWEGREWPGLNWINAEVKPLEVQAQGLRVPHMGWNELVLQSESVLASDLDREPVFYFIHGYHLIPDDSTIVKAICDYGVSIASVLEFDNIFATQFHPEKSQKAGLQILRNFVNY